MADQFTQFHYKLSKSTYHPDYEAENFDIKDIFTHSTMKVSHFISHNLANQLIKL